MKKTIVAAALLSVASLSTFAAETPLPKNGGPGVVDYHYGQHLDVVKLESLKKSSEVSGVASVIMTYEDHQGITHQVKFLEESYNANSNG